MGNNASIPNINYEDMQLAIKSSRYIIINTLPSTEQHCLIHKTIPWNKEELILNEKIKLNCREQIIVYGKNGNDQTIIEKYTQCTSLGFHVYIYRGGLFEWLLLQDIYGSEEFPTFGKEIDILKYKNPSFLTTHFISN